MAPHPKKISHSPKSEEKSKNRHLPRFTLILGSRGPQKMKKKVFQSTMKLTKIVVEGGSSATTESVGRGRWTLFF
jgi:hypothetical protein